MDDDQDQNGKKRSLFIIYYDALIIPGDLATPQPRSSACVNVKCVNDHALPINKTFNKIDYRLGKILAKVIDVTMMQTSIID